MEAPTAVVRLGTPQVLALALDGSKGQCTGMGMGQVEQHLAWPISRMAVLVDMMGKGQEGTTEQWEGAIRRAVIEGGE